MEKEVIYVDLMAEDWAGKVALVSEDLLSGGG